MSRPSQLRYWKRRKVYFCQLNGQRHYLGKNKKAAQAEFHRLMVDRPKRAASGTLTELIDQFLDWVKKHRAPDTYEWYQSRLQLFVTRYPDLLVSELKKFHITQWIDSFEVTSGTKRNFARSIIRCLNWAEDEELIDRNPIQRFKKPRAGKRETVISPEEFAMILAAIKRQPFKDLVIFAWETGARAAECLALEASHLDLRNHRVVFPVEEEKMERAPRIIYLTDRAEEIVRRLVRQQPKGRLFRNSEGAPWTTDAVNCAFASVQRRFGKRQLMAKKFELPEAEVDEMVEELRATRIAKNKSKIPENELREDARRRLWNKYAEQRGTKYCLTVIRHSWCHRMLRSGVDALTVSVLMGHADPSMVAKVYSHLAHAPDYLLGTVRKKPASVPAAS